MIIPDIHVNVLLCPHLMRAWESCWSVSIHCRVTGNLLLNCIAEMTRFDLHVLSNYICSTMEFKKKSFCLVFRRKQHFLCSRWGYHRCQLYTGNKQIMLCILHKPLSKLSPLILGLATRILKWCCVGRSSWEIRTSYPWLGPMRISEKSTSAGSSWGI